LADSLDWATNVGYPGYSNAAIDDIYSQWIVNNMFAKAAQGVMSPEDAVKEAEAKARDIFAKWKERKLL
jgi:multiple sugar transport system substrate-binding protein